jgi:hypothetical protein
VARAGIPDLAFTNVDGLIGPGLAAGTVTYADTFGLQPFAIPMMSRWLSVQQIINTSASTAHVVDARKTAPCGEHPVVHKSRRCRHDTAALQEEMAEHLGHAFRGTLRLVLSRRIGWCWSGLVAT